jgi:hypothetical protein
MAGILHGPLVYDDVLKEPAMTMTPPPDDEQHAGSGMAGLLKSLGILAVVLLAMLAVLFVLDLVPREMLSDVAVKSFVILGIVAVASVAIGLLVRGRGDA